MAQSRMIKIRQILDELPLNKALELAEKIAALYRERSRFEVTRLTKGKTKVDRDANAMGGIQ